MVEECNHKLVKYGGYYKCKKCHRIFFTKDLLEKLTKAIGTIWGPENTEILQKQINQILAESEINEDGSFKTDL